MSTDSQQIVNKAWNFAHVLRDDGLSYMAYGINADPCPIRSGIDSLAGDPGER